ncbi:MAG: cyclodeaminase/cyclohydrolase family protein [Anaerovoracaceae bacterium]
MIYTEKTCREFTQATASRQPVPGGGSVSALTGALGAALGNMVGALTVGKKKYADAEEYLNALMKESEELQEELLDLVQKDVDIFKSLSELYKIKAETEEEKLRKAERMEDVLEKACDIPIMVMKKCGRAIELSKGFAEKGSSAVLSDAGASAAICKAALQAASLNVYINTNSMKDRIKADRLNTLCGEYMEKYTYLADEVFGYVTDKLRGKI